jgi:hypothetical protein
VLLRSFGASRGRKARINFVTSLGKAYLIGEVGKQNRRSKERVLNRARKRPEHRGLLTICQPIVGSCPNLGEWWGQRCHTQTHHVCYLIDIVVKFGQRGE